MAALTLIILLIDSIIQFVATDRSGTSFRINKRVVGVERLNLKKIIHQCISISSTIYTFIIFQASIFNELYLYLDNSKYTLWNINVTNGGKDNGLITSTQELYDFNERRQSYE